MFGLMLYLIAQRYSTFCLPFFCVQFVCFHFVFVQFTVCVFVIQAVCYFFGVFVNSVGGGLISIPALLIGLNEPAVSASL